MTPVALLPILLLAVAPLSADQTARLETARDDRDPREEALAALLENAAGWTAGLGDAAIRLEPDLDALVADPAAHRGDLCLLEGAIQQRASLDPPFDGAVEWFLRDEAGRPIAVYLPASDAAPFRDGQRIRMPARFYKRTRERGRDGVERTYPAFVGADPALVGAPTSGASTRLVMMGLGLATLLVLFLAALLAARATRRPRRPLTSPASGEWDDRAEPLPDDPLDALEALQRRAGREDVE